MDGDDVIGAHELTIRAGITHRMLDHWARTGIARPVNGGTPGTGVNRQYDHREARIIITMGRLVRGGLDPRTARDTAEHMETTGEATIGGYTITARGHVRRRGWHLAGARRVT